MSTVDAQIGQRSLGRAWFSGLVITLGVHGLLGMMVYLGQVKSAPREPAIRDLLVTKTISLGKPREKFWLPRIVTPPPPPPPPPPEAIKIANSPDAAAAPPTPPKDPPKPEDKRISSDLRRALQRAKMLSQAAKEEPPEGSLTGSATGNSSSAEEGDEYATQVRDAIHRNWSSPSGLLDEAQLAQLEAVVRVRISDSGQLSGASLVKPSGNALFDDSAVQAVKSTSQVPPIPPASRARFRRGLEIEFTGKDLPR